MSREQEAYLALADEMNDEGIPPWNEAEWDAESVKLGKKFAKENGLRWPPGTGDFDRFYDAQNN